MFGLIIEEIFLTSHIKHFITPLPNETTLYHIRTYACHDSNCRGTESATR